MRSRLAASIAALWLAGSSLLAAQDHGTARPEPVKVAPAVVPPVAAAKGNINVTPTVPPAKVAAAVAEALRQAEAAAAKRAARETPRAPVRAGHRVVTSASTRRYEVRWPNQRMVVHWPGATDDRVRLKWPD